MAAQIKLKCVGCHAIEVRPLDKVPVEGPAMCEKCFSPMVAVEVRIGGK